jgi:hypothetical protein
LIYAPDMTLTLRNEKSADFIITFTI